jgi:hypothetical protein
MKWSRSFAAQTGAKREPDKAEALKWLVNSTKYGALRDSWITTPSARLTMLRNIF